MHIAILGATSQIARDTILSVVAEGKHALSLYARRPEVVAQWLGPIRSPSVLAVDGFDSFGMGERFDAIINFVGVGKPAQTAALGASIFDITDEYDALAVRYVKAHSGCRYVFLSSGAAYGGSFAAPVDEHTHASVAINGLSPSDWYSAAKLLAECRHRALQSLPLVDLRVFNYYSHRQDFSARFLITDMVRAIAEKKPMLTSRVNITRDFIGPEDFNRLLMCVLEGEATNDVYDCYTRAPIDKLTLLAVMTQVFGLEYTFDEQVSPNPTGAKMHYYSRNRRASHIGFEPLKDSLQTVLDETRAYLLKRLD